MGKEPVQDSGGMQDVDLPAQNLTEVVVRGSSILDRGTVVSVGILITLLGATAYATQWMTRVDARLERIERQVHTGVADRWRGRDMKVWANALQQLNPELAVPLVPDADD